MLKTKIIFIIFLTVTCALSFEWLYDVNKNKQPFVYNSPLLPFVKIKNKVIELPQEDKYFKPNFNYKIYSLKKYRDYFFKKNTKDANTIQYEIIVDDNFFKIKRYFDVKYLAPKIEIIEIVKEIIPPQSNKMSPQNETPIKDTGPYIKGVENIEIPLNSDLHILNQRLSQNIESNYPVSIDYSEVNLSETGDYPVFYHCKNLTKQINVHVY